MISVSTVAMSGMAVFDFAEYLRKCNCNDTGIELFFDTLPFLNASYFKRYINDFVETGRIGMHCPMVDCEILAEKGTLLLRYSLDRHEECFELAAGLGSPYLVLHTNSLKPMDFSEALRKKELLTERVMLMADMAQKYGCQLWVENMGSHRHGNIVVDIEAYTDLILSHDNIYSLIDTGHAHINGWDIPALLARLGRKVRGLHIHDNDGKSDQHLPIHHGSIDWGPVLEAIRLMGDSCERILEYAQKTPYNFILQGRDILKQCT